MGISSSRYRKLGTCPAGSFGWSRNSGIAFDRSLMPIRILKYTTQVHIILQLKPYLTRNINMFWGVVSFTSSGVWASHVLIWRTKRIYSCSVRSSPSRSFFLSSRPTSDRLEVFGTYLLSPESQAYNSKPSDSTSTFKPPDATGCDISNPSSRPVTFSTTPDYNQTCMLARLCHKSR